MELQELMNCSEHVYSCDGIQRPVYKLDGKECMVISLSYQGVKPKIWLSQSYATKEDIKIGGVRLLFTEDEVADFSREYVCHGTAAQLKIEGMDGMVTMEVRS